MKELGVEDIEIVRDVAEACYDDMAQYHEARTGNIATPFQLGRETLCGIASDRATRYIQDKGFFAGRAIHILHYSSLLSRPTPDYPNDNDLVLCLAWGQLADLATYTNFLDTEGRRDCPFYFGVRQGLRELLGTTYQDAFAPASLVGLQTAYREKPGHPIAEWRMTTSSEIREGSYRLGKLSTADFLRIQPEAQ